MEEPNIQYKCGEDSILHHVQVSIPNQIIIII